MHQQGGTEPGVGPNDPCIISHNLRISPFLARSLSHTRASSGRRKRSGGTAKKNAETPKSSARILPQRSCREMWGRTAHELLSGLCECVLKECTPGKHYRWLLSERRTSSVQPHAGGVHKNPNRSGEGQKARCDL
ncbi:Uncharacterized protein DAT39_004128, partial [Clarias magur]